MSGWSPHRLQPCQGLLEASQTPWLTEDCQAVIQAKARRLAGHGHTQGMDDLAVTDALGPDEVLQPLLQCHGIERCDRLQTRLHLPQYAGCLRRCAEVLCEGRLVIQQWLVDGEEMRVLQDVASHLDALASRLHDLVHGLQLRRSRDWR